MARSWELLLLWGWWRGKQNSSWLDRKSWAGEWWEMLARSGWGLKPRQRNINSPQRKNTIILLGPWFRKSSLSLFNHQGMPMFRRALHFHLGKSYSTPLSCRGFLQGCYCRRSAKSKDPEDTSCSSSVFYRAWCLSRLGWWSWILATTAQTFLGLRIQSPTLRSRGSS